MIGMIRWIGVTAVLPVAGACGLLPDAYSGCEKPQPYQSAEEVAPLRVPAGSDVPDTRNALQIPEVKAPEQPADSAACLDHPPRYGPPPQRGE
jgi:uncharacterized lipoprotein